MTSDKLLRWVVIEMSDATSSGAPMAISAYGPFEDKTAAKRFSDRHNEEHA